MRLRIVTPLSVAVDAEGVGSVRAEDTSGGFGILDHHAEFLTSLCIGVVSWKAADGAGHYCAVRGGVLTVEGGAGVMVATREAVTGDDLGTLDGTVLARFRDEAEADRSERVDGIRLQLEAIRRMVGRLGAGGRRL